MTNFAPEKKPFPKALRPDKKLETKGESFRKKIKEAVERGEEKKLPKRDPEKIMEIDKSLKNLKSDERFPKPKLNFRRQGVGKKDKSAQEPNPPSRKPGPNPPPRKPGEKKEMQPLSKGGRAGFKRGSKGCKLAMKGKGRAYGKNS